MVSQLSEIRRRELLAVVKERGHCTIGELCERFAISVPTAHRDINVLMADSAVRKVHGGVEYVPESEGTSSWNSGFEVRISRHRARKQEVACKAIRLLEPDDVVFLDSSTTALYLARELIRSDLGRLTIVTNSGCIASEFHRFSRDTTLISIGGIYNAQLNSFLGGIARGTMEGLRINKVFLSAVGVSEHGIFTFHEDHAVFLGRLIERCETGVLLADSSKFGREALFRICGLGELGVVVSDCKLEPEGWLADSGLSLL
ncbi:MAG: DeoR/GlpR transcriptional regulator [Lentisphaerae bacterium]|jgi:DeoR/GlpR family transcriptional regulator of sugar metabolism|nr:DeoR/GlpR transcriptional regulator [Lentisphaerota bacterium]MBT4815984.1 DeoR/GlpR transcriptional regulator [Lentisphaerota bacterium]MBT5607319.1 DeoR/GlpR transcriptional regulator [Lentisphaerota bacterium]MBT7055363.1 DeoR/GlpR transcriptional regulator [Lentisphaerota bacterium]MBT7840961.1 DeoR/GlpR transcriptional regulator [Lentisphaerota bacterium]